MGVACGFLDIIVAVRNAALVGDEDNITLLVERTLFPFNLASARALAEHSNFTTRVCLQLAASENLSASFDGAAWVDELCLRIVGDDDTPGIRNLALAELPQPGLSAPSTDFLCAELCLILTAPDSAGLC